MPARRLGTLSALGAVLLSGACSDQGPRLPACTGDVAVTVSAGTQPTFSWTPACQLEGLIVALPGPGAVVWSVASPGQDNSIAPPIHYGITPPGAAFQIAATALAPGSTYEMALFRFDDGGGGSIQPAASGSFVP